MANRKNTKRALLASAVALFLCVSMLIGTTFAWFTDSVTSGKNQIISGTLDIELNYKNAVMEKFEKVDGKSDLFVDADGKKMLWEPGAASVVYLELKNEGTLALKYRLSVLVKDIVTGSDGAALSKVLKTAVVEIDEDTVGIYDRKDAIAAAEADDAESVLNYKKEDEMEAGADPLYLAMIVYFPAEIGNTFDGAVYNRNDKVTLETELGLSLIATQADVEKDSFGNDYDKDVELVAEAKNADSLAAALAIGGAIKLTGDIDVEGKLDIPEGTNVDLDLAGHELTIDVQNSSDKAGIHNKGALNITNGTISVKNSGAYQTCGIAADGQDTTLTNVTITVANAEGVDKSVYGVYVYGGDLTVDGGEINVATDGTSHAYGIYVSTVNTVGGVQIKNVTVNAEALNSHAYGIYTWKNIALISGVEVNAHSQNNNAYGIHVNAKDVTIKKIENSTVAASTNAGPAKSDYGICLNYAGDTIGLIRNSTITGGYRSIHFNGQGHVTVTADTVLNGTVNKPEYITTLGEDVEVASSGEDFLESGKYILADDMNLPGNAEIKDIEVDLNGNTLTPDWSRNAYGDLIFKNGDWVMAGSYGHVDVRVAADDEGSSVTFKNITVNNKLPGYTGGAPYDFIGYIVKVNFDSNGNGKKVTVCFEDCVLDNAAVDIATLSGYTGEIDVKFERCTFNLTGKTDAIKVNGSSITGKISVNDCVFNYTPTATYTKVVNIDRNNITVSGERNTVNLYTPAEDIKVQGTPNLNSILGSLPGAIVNDLR